MPVRKIGILSWKLGPNQTGFISGTITTSYIIVRCLCYHQREIYIRNTRIFPLDHGREQREFYNQAKDGGRESTRGEP